jgi:Tol biopolymer transport system component
LFSTFEPVQTHEVALTLRTRLQVADAEALLGPSTHPSISEDGRFVTFQTGASDLAPPGSDNNSSFDVYVRDRDIDHDGIYDEVGGVSTMRITTGVDANGGGYFPQMTGDGRFVAFLSSYNQYTAGDSTVLDVFCANAGLVESSR